MATPPTARSRSDLFGAIVTEHRDGLVSFAEKRLGDHGLAEDIVQEALIRAWRNIDQLVGIEGAVRSWLFTVTRHLVIDWVRRPQARFEVVGDVSDRLAEGRDAIESVHDVLVARPLLRLLSAEHRAVLVHIYLCDRSIQETAALLGVPAGTVKSRQFNALRRLRAVAQAA
ncbi:sigma-70 family RNA polymerase sigma factor [Streptomyces sp. V4-01]|uniref:RNA polymerase sigma factor n=1 Tax=Actinacidiphila polyblastidii TaxID=3110430 RepID=A0ABU7PML5_9ACTN|nr:sigma-70 family RNA polymerase sigma factor [Streptomyces sp. V4-01]